MNPRFMPLLLSLSGDNTVRVTGLSSGRSSPCRTSVTG
jgi:hypothetical protein